MTYVPANVVMVDPVFVSSYGRNSLGSMYQGTRQSAPASGTVGTSNRIFYHPFYLSKPYALARWWWLNGATVGTDYIHVGIYDQNLNLFKASPRTLSAGTANQVQYANPGIHGTNITSGADSTDATTYTTASVTLKAGVLYLLSVSNTHGSSAAAISSVDNGPTFTSRSTVQYNGTLSRQSIWSCVPTTDYTGTLVINFGGGNTQTAAKWSLDAFYHVDTATNDGIVQNATGTGNSTTPLATLAAFGSANNATFGAFGGATVANPVLTASAGYVKLSDANGASTPSNWIGSVFRPDNDTTVDGTLGTSSQWGACAVEIKSLGTDAIVIPAMRGYMAFVCSGITATVFRLTSAEPMRPFYYIQSNTPQLPPVAGITGGNNVGLLPVYGFTSRSSP